MPWPTQQPTEEAPKQRRKRQKAAAEVLALGIEKFTVEVAGIFKPDLRRLMRAHNINKSKTCAKGC